MTRMAKAKASLVVFLMIAVGPQAFAAAATRPSDDTPDTQAKAKPESNASPTSQANIKDYEDLVREYHETIARNNDEFDRIKLDEAKRQEFLRTKHDWIVQQDFANRFLKLARAHPGSPAAFHFPGVDRRLCACQF